MAELDAKFEAAVGVIQGLPKDGSFQPSNEMKLKFYGFYKQAREGVCTGARPSFWDVVARAKFDAWHELGDMSSEAAKEGYIDALKQIIETMNLNSDVEKFIEVTAIYCYLKSIYVATYHTPAMCYLMGKLVIVPSLMKT